MLSALPFFQTANYMEAALWLLIAAGCAIAATRTSGMTRRNCTIAAVAFAFFGISDIIEASTGAWYRPWWLLPARALLVAGPVHRRSAQTAIVPLTGKDSAARPTLSFGSCDLACKGAFFF